MTKAFEEVWRAVAGAADFPRYEALPLQDAVYGPNALTLEVIKDGEDFKYLYVGEAIKRRSSIDTTGLTMSALPGRGPGSLVFANAQRVYETATLSRQSIAFVGVGSETVETRQILAPCGRHTGRPTHLICVIDYVPRAYAPPPTVRGGGVD